jgi:hypothetical protein
MDAPCAAVEAPACTLAGPLLLFGVLPWLPWRPLAVLMVGAEVPVVPWEGGAPDDSVGADAEVSTGEAA